MRVLNIVLITLCTTFLAFWACSQNPAGPSNENAIIGEWQWVMSSGGFAGQTVTPGSAGFDLSYTFSADSTVVFTKNDTALFTSKFQMAGDTLKIEAISIKQSVKIENDQLTLTELCMDCFTHTYIRKNSASNNIIIIDDFVLMGLKGDAVQINSASIDSDNLSISVSYSGGCQDHDFKLFAGETFMESESIQSGLVLVHNARKDACDAWITETLSFNLINLKKQYQEIYGKGKSGKIRLNLSVAGSDSVYTPSPLYQF